MVNKRFGLGILAMVLVFGMMVVGCDNSTNGNNNVGSINSAVLAQLQGEWTKGEQRITFSGNAQFALIDIWAGNIDGVTTGLTTNILSITTNRVTYGNPQFGLPEESFNFSISGNTLTVTNWSVIAEASVMNGTYTRSEN